MGLQDTNSWKIAYSGAGHLTDLTFNPAATAATAGNPTGGNNGVDSGLNYFSNLYPGAVFLPDYQSVYDRNVQWGFGSRRCCGANVQQSCASPVEWNEPMVDDGDDIPNV